MASEKTSKAVKAVKAKAQKDPNAPVRVRRPRGTVDFGESNLNATRAWEAAQARGATGTLDDFHVAYNKTSRRRKAKLNDPAFLRARLAALECFETVVETDVPR